MITLVPIFDYSRETLAGLARRLQNSKRPEELVYRESELDEIWRLIDGDRLGAAAEFPHPVDIGALLKLQQAIHQVHDLVAEADDGVGAGRRLTEAMLECGAVLERVAASKSNGSPEPNS